MAGHTFSLLFLISLPLSLPACHLLPPLLGRSRAPVTPIPPHISLFTGALRPPPLIPHGVCRSMPVIRFWNRFSRILYIYFSFIFYAKRWSSEQMEGWGAKGKGGDWALLFCVPVTQQRHKVYCILRFFFFYCTFVFFFPPPFCFPLPSIPLPITFLHLSSCFYPSLLT